MQCPACDHDNEPAVRICKGCGARLARTSPSCGKEAGPRARFCPECGATLTEPAVDRAATRPQPALRRRRSIS